MRSVENCVACRDLASVRQIKNRVPDLPGQLVTVHGTRSVSDCIQSDTYHYYISVSDHSVTRSVSDCKYCSDTGSQLICIITVY